jgi:ribonuclease HI
MNDWWTMYFNEAVNISGNGDGAVIISLEKKQYHVLVGLQFECTNNTTKYEACIVNLQAALKLEVEKFDVYRDSILPGEGEMTN